MPKNNLKVLKEKLQMLQEYIKVLGAGSSERNTIYTKSNSKRKHAEATQNSLHAVMEWDYFCNELEFE